MSQHTPGPWIKDRNLITDQDGQEIATATYRQSGHVQANAHLIAAAPEMLALLTDVGQWLEIGLQRGQINRGTANRDGDLVSQIRAAIAKAEGREGA